MRLTNKKFKLLAILFWLFILIMILEALGVFRQIYFLDSFSYFITAIIPILFLFLNIDFKKSILLNPWFFGFLILTFTTFFLILKVFEEYVFYFSIGYLIIFIPLFLVQSLSRRAPTSPM
jgi:hypothetical protein